MSRNEIFGWRLRRCVFPLLFSLVWVWCIPSERDDGGEKAGCGCAARERAAEFDGVERQAFCSKRIGVVRVRATDRTMELEHEALAMAARPFCNNVGDDATIVAGAEFERSVEGAGHVNAVHP